MASNCLNSMITAIDISIPSAEAVDPSPLPSTRNYTAHSQWLRPAVLGATDGIISISSLMIGIGAVNQAPHAMLISGFAGLIAGAFSMAIGEFVSIYTQYDIESTQLNRDFNDDDEKLLRPWKAAAASAIAFASGATLPWLSGGFIEPWVTRVVVIAVVSSIGLAVFGAGGAVMGGAAAWKAAVRVLVGGWIAMFVTFGVLKLFMLAFQMDLSNAT